MRIHEYNIPRYKERLAAFRKYRALVDKLTERVAHLVHGIEKRKFREWDLDHIIPAEYSQRPKINTSTFNPRMQ